MEELITGTTTVFPVQDQSMVGEARRRLEVIAGSLGFDGTQAGRLAIAVTELGTNLMKHAGGGELLVTSCAGRGCTAIDLLAIDRGPGITDVSSSLRDGFSTAGSAGTGLGALRRLSRSFDIYSREGTGTVAFVRIHALEKFDDRMPMVVAGICVPHTGETVAGDAWSIAITSDSATLLLCDGLGHGPLAAEAAHEAVEAFRRTADRAPIDIVDEIHGSLRATRGAVAGVLRVDLVRRRAKFSGVGNITAVIATDQASRRLLSHNGTLGSTPIRIRENDYAFDPGAVSILYSDGLASHIDVERYPGLLSRHPAVVCGVIYRDLKRGRDDATIVVARERGETA